MISAIVTVLSITNKEIMMFKDMLNKILAAAVGHRSKAEPEFIIVNPAGSKLAKKAFEGNCTLRTGVGAAGRLALEGKLNAKSKL